MPMFLPGARDPDPLAPFTSCAKDPTPDTVDYQMPERFFQYKAAVWQKHRTATPAAEWRAKGHRLSPLLPVVLYTGKAGWTGPRRLTEVTAHAEELAGLLTELEYQIVDVGRITDEELARPGNWARTVLHLIWAFIHNVPGPKFVEITSEFKPYWGVREVELTLHILYHYACAEGRPEVARRLSEILKPEEVAMSEPEVTGRRFWEVWVEEGEAKGEVKGRAAGLLEGEARGEARGEAKGLAEQIAAIRDFFQRKGLDWERYEGDVRGFDSTPQAARFLVDLATAADMRAFLREKFGH